MVTKINNCSTRSNTVMMKLSYIYDSRGTFIASRVVSFFLGKAQKKAKTLLKNKKWLIKIWEICATAWGSEVLNLAWKSKNAVFITFSYLLSSFSAKVKIVISKPIKYQNMVFILLVTAVPQFYWVPKIFLFFSIKGNLFWDIYHNATFLER